MDAGVTSFRSILDKPLTQLTEEDISQLTREDCRKYLKEKGMRRPSWNKSQAIQQVISLKALLETSEDSGAGALRRILVARTLPVTQNSADSAKEANVDVNNMVSVSVEESVPSRQNDSPKSAPTGEFECNPEETDVKARSPCSVNEFVGQMTIFYCGKVNVYDGVNPNKAQAIMHLAASPIQFPYDDGVRGNLPFVYPCNLQNPSEKHGLIPTAATTVQTTQTEKMAEYYQHCVEKANITYDPDAESQVNRQASLQRYRDKRKDRGRNKGKKNLGPTSSLEPYMNHHARTQPSNVQLIGSSSSSPQQAGFSHYLSNSAEKQAKTANLSVDLNEDVQEC